MPRAAEDFEVALARLEASPDEVRALLVHLSAQERQRAARFFFERHRRRYVVARAMLRELLGARLGLRPGAVELAYGGNGKPRLANGALNFSVSHCDEVALFAFSKSCEIGADIEALRPIRAADSIAAHFFSRRENQAYRALPPRERLLGFLQCWTRKEALAKGIGVGLATPPQKLDPAAAPGWRVHSFIPLRGFIAAIACHPA